jgi:8-oxo-dGTP diphosphatase
VAKVKKISKPFPSHDPGGEGSRGGNVIGHTKSGKPIYGDHLNEGHIGFDMSDHKDAANFHNDVVEATANKIDAIREKDPNFAIPQKIIEFLNHHRKQAQFHQAKANTKMDIKERNQKQVAQVMREQAMGKFKKAESNYYVAVVPINPLGQVLMAKRKEDGIWTTPAGGADLGETPEEAAVRECWEEANLVVLPEQLESIGVKEAPNGKPVHCFLFRCSQISTEVKSDPDREVNEWLWRDPRNFPKGLSSEKNKNRLETINHAMLKFMGLKKSDIAMNGEHGNPSVETADYAIEENSARS